MEIVPVKQISIFLIIVFIIAWVIIAYVGGILRVKKLAQLLMKEGGYEEFLRTVNKYLEGAKNKKQINYYKYIKLGGLIKHMEWGEAKELIEDINVSWLPHQWIDLYCNTTVTAFLLGGLDEGYALEEKLKTAKLKTKKNLWLVNLVYTIAEFYRSPVKDHREKFKELIETQSEITLTSIGYYYLGLIEQQAGNLTESKAYYEKAKTIGRPTSLTVKKAEEALQNLKLD